MKPLEVDAFAIDFETLLDATKQGMRGDWAAYNVAQEVIKNLSLDDKKRFEEYQEQNNPCR